MRIIVGAYEYVPFGKLRFDTYDSNSKDTQWMVGGLEKTGVNIV